MSEPRLILDPIAISESWEERRVSRPDASPFTHSVFLEGLDELVPWQRAMISWTPSVAQQVFIRKRGPHAEVVVPPFSPHSAIISSPGTGKPGMLAALSHVGNPVAGLPSDRTFIWDPDLIEVPHGTADAAAERAEASPASLSLREFDPPSGFLRRELQTYVLRPAPLDEAVSTWSASTRRTLRQHIDAYLFDEVPSSEASSHLNELVDLVQTAYARRNRSLPLSPEGLASWAGRLLQNGVGRMYILRSPETGLIVAGIVVLTGGPRAWYWLSGSVPGPAMTVLIGLVQQQLRDHEIHSFDLMGANTDGISEFKRRFGGESVSYPMWIRQGVMGRVVASMARFGLRFR